MIDPFGSTIREMRAAATRLAMTVAATIAAGMFGAIQWTAAAAMEADEPPKVTEAHASPLTIDVTVRAKDTGKPIEGATVRPTIGMRHSLRKTDRQGRARIILFQHKSREALNIDVWAEGYVQQRHFFSQNDVRYLRIPDRVAIELLSGEQTLGGTVNDERGHPIKGVKVEIWGYLGEKKKKDELAYKVDALTDEQGRWRCRCFRDMQFAYLYLSHPDYVSDDNYHPRRHGHPTPSMPAQPDERPLQALRDFSDMQVMTRGAEVAGEVRDERGKPIEGAEVGWMEADKNQTLRLDDSAMMTTDRQGHFRFANARPGRLMLQIKARGHAPELTPVVGKVAANPDPVTIRLGPAHKLEGRVVDSQGKPIAYAFVGIDTWRKFRSLGVFLETDADGRFRWEDAPADTVLINVSRTGFTTVIMQPVTAGKEIVLTLRRSVSISGRIRDATTGKPIEQTQVEVGTPDPKDGGFRWARHPQVFGIQGRLQASVDVEQTPEFRLRIRADGHEPFESRSFRAEERQVEYDVSMKRSGSSG